MRLRSSMSETSFYPSEPHPIIIGPPAALILSAWHRSRPKPICCKLYGHGRCEARSCGLIFQSLRHGKSPYFFFERSLPRMTLENQRERAQGRLFCSLLLTDSGSFFFFFFCVLIVSSCLCTCKYFISLPAFCLTPGDLMRRSQERTSLQDNGPAATYPSNPYARPYRVASPALLPTKVHAKAIWMEDRWKRWDRKSNIPYITN